MSLTCYIAEYPSIVSRAAKEGWLEPLITTHALPCSEQEALDLLKQVPLPRGTRVRFRAGKGSAGRRNGQFSIGLPKKTGTRARTLRVGLVLHEAAHVIDYVKYHGWNHGETYCQVLRALLGKTNWRKDHMSNFRAIFDRHRGPYCIMLIRETVKKDKTIPASETLNGPYTAEEAHEEARMLVSDPRENVTGAYVYSLAENQHIGAIYKKGEAYLAWAELPMPVTAPRVEEPVVELPAWATPGPRASDRPVVEATVSAAPAAKTVTAKASPVRRKGVALGVGREDGWPASEAAQAVRGYFTASRKTAAPAEIIAALGPKLNELGVAHPASLVSRLKQAGLLKEIAA